LNSSQTLYDIPGIRRDLFMQISIGISKYFELKAKSSKSTSKSKKKGAVRKSKPRR
jgi:hypothetical protein